MNAEELPNDLDRKNALIKRMLIQILRLRTVPHHRACPCEVCTLLRLAKEEVGGRIRTPAAKSTKTPPEAKGIVSPDGKSFTDAPKPKGEAA